MTPLPIRSAASPKPAIAQAGKVLLSTGVVAMAGVRRFLGLVLVPVVVGVVVAVVGGVLAVAAWVGTERGGGFGFRLGCRRGGGAAAAVVAAVGSVKVGVVVVTCVSVGNVVVVAVGSVTDGSVVSAAVESSGAAAGARRPIAKPKAAMTAPKHA